MTSDLLVGFVKLFNVAYYRIVPIVLISLFSYAIWCGIEQLRGRLSQQKADIRSAALGFSFVGIAIGIMVGASREPIAQAGMSGFLALVTAFCTYAYAKDSLEQFRSYAVPILMTLSMTLVFGGYYGSALREDREAFEKGIAYKQALSTAISAARTDICKQVAIKALETKLDPIESLPRVCLLELGFVPIKLKTQ